MPGFLSLFDETERIPLSPPGADRDYWVEVKHYLSGDEDDEVTNAGLGLRGMELNATVGLDEQQIRGRLDVVAQSRILLLHSIVNWNLTDRDDRPLALAPREAKERSINSLPAGVRDLIAQTILEIRKAQKRTPAEQANFRGKAAGGDHDGHEPAASALGVLDGGGLLAAPGPAEGGSAPAPD